MRVHKAIKWHGAWYNHEEGDTHHEGRGGDSPSQLIDARIKELSDQDRQCAGTHLRMEQSGLRPDQPQ
jgi:hypothetical protein